jgi:hypothetical protein
MATVLEGFGTEELSSVVRFLWTKGLNAKYIFCSRWEMFVA